MNDLEYHTGIMKKIYSVSLNAPRWRNRGRVGVLGSDHVDICKYFFFSLKSVFFFQVAGKSVAPYDITIVYTRW